MASIALENEFWSAEWLPEIGGKMTSFRGKASDFEYLWQPPSGERPRPADGAAYDPEYATGFDECFPTIQPCEYPDGPWRGMPMPHHGEVWRLPWQQQHGRGHYDLWVEGHILPYRLYKKVALEADGGLLFEYMIENRSDDVLHYLWSAHPLFNVLPGTRIEVAGAPALVVSYSPSGRLGAIGDRHTWPNVGKVDLSRPGEWAQAADKVFLPELENGRVAVRHEELGEGVLIEWDTRHAPCLGLWYNLRGWPEKAPHYNIAVEPCTTPSELLTDSAAWVAPRSSVSWWMKWTVVR